VWCVCVCVWLCVCVCVCGEGGASARHRLGAMHVLLRTWHLCQRALTQAEPRAP
jgi:hypothetical protein